LIAKVLIAIPKNKKKKFLLKRYVKKKI